VFSVLATGPNGCTPSFGWEVKLDVPCCKILRHEKDLLKSHGDR
jgi:hypothetical protein